MNSDKFGKFDDKFSGKLWIIFYKMKWEIEVGEDRVLKIHADIIKAESN